MANISVTQCIGFLNRTADFLDKYKTNLTAKKFDATDAIARLRAAALALSALDEAQEAIKTQLKNKTIEVETALGDDYGDCSTTLDIAIGALGKTTPEGKEGSTIRSSLGGRGPRESAAAAKKTTPGA